MPQTILLIDDEPNLLRSLSRVLQHEDYRIFTARSAEECMHILKAHSVDLIVSDEMMQGMRGTDLLRWASDFFAEIPRILLTGCTNKDVVDRAVTEGRVYCVLQKPCQTADLTNAIRTALSLRKSTVSTEPLKAMGTYGDAVPN